MDSRAPRARRAGSALLALVASVLAVVPCHADDAPPADRTSIRGSHPRGEPQATFGAQAGSSTWPGDPVALTTLKLAWRFQDVIAPFFMGRLGYGHVNDRSLLTLAIGAQLWGRIGPVRPYLRAAIQHQHEESLAAVRNEPFGALFGIGDGIRHRAGGDFAAGVDLPLHHGPQLHVYATVEAVADWFPDPRGPSLYALGSAALGVSHSFF
jgi:hypothetical protein